MKEWTEDRLLEMSGGTWPIMVIHSSVMLDLYSNLDANAEEISEKLNYDLRGLKVLLNAISSLGLIEKEGEIYKNTKFSKKYLTTESEYYLGHIVKHHYYLINSWQQLPTAVKNGGPVQKTSSSQIEDHDRRESFLMGMFNLASKMAPIVLRNIDLTGKKKLLDLAGGPGTYALNFANKYSDLTCDILDYPTTEEFADRTIQRFGLANRVKFIPGDVYKTAFRADYDVVWMSHILHSEGEASCLELVQKVYDSLLLGGEIFIHEFVLDDSEVSPSFAALFSINMFLRTQSGKSYTASKLSEILNHAGFTKIEIIELGKSPSKIIKTTK